MVLYTPPLGLLLLVALTFQRLVFVCIFVYLHVWLVIYRFADLQFYYLSTYISVLNVLYSILIYLDTYLLVFMYYNHH